MSKSTLSPTARTMRLLRQQGGICEVVERWISFGKPKPGEREKGAKGKGLSGVRRDLFGFIDVLWLDPDPYRPRFVAIQCCAGGGGDHAERRRKILENAVAPEWLRAGGRIEIWSWSRTMPRGTRLIRWKPRVEAITLAHFGDKHD